MRLALTGPVGLEVLASYFRQAGYEVHGPDSPPLEVFKPDYVYDVTSHDRVLADEVEGFFDARFERLAGCPYSLAGIRAIVDEFAWYRLGAEIRAAGVVKKVLAVDADNTLWKGILSEDGAAALEPFAAFQRGLRALRDEGVLLVLASKNDPFEFRADMPLANGDFAYRAVNWSPKPGNLLVAARTLGLDVAAFAFVDDNPHERAQMAAHLPSVSVVPFPSDLAHPRSFLRRLREYVFTSAGRTDEDRLRAADYRANELRSTFDGYLEDLGLRVRPARAAEGDLDRLAQMAGKTNQFNATAIRRTRDEFAALLKDPDRAVFVFRAGDRFGEQGLVCYVVADRAARRITDFVMSCRAMGRTLEHFAYGYVTRELGGDYPIDFTPTARNRPFADFLEALGRGVTRTYFKEET